MKRYDFRTGVDYNVLSGITKRNIKENSEIKTAVDGIINDVKANGDKALFEYTRRFDGIDLTPETLMISDDAISKAYNDIDEKLLESIRKAISNIKEFHEKQMANTWMDFKDGIIYGQRIRPLQKVGIYVPGGSAAYPSSVLMNAIPAKVAGVEDIIMVTPPKEKLNSAVLVAAHEVGIKRIYRVGGAQAIAALAFGTESIPKVDKIVGPGNIYVAVAKKSVYGYVDIDMVAGPSEILIVADDTANPKSVAADLMSQAEHDKMASAILITTSEELVSMVEAELNKQIIHLERRDIIKESLEDYGALVLVKNLDDALYIANEIAPEHLELAIKEPFVLLPNVKNAGAVFLGYNAPEPLGDYMAGPNHVLPTSGTARFFSPLSVDDFMKKMSVLYYSHDRLMDVKDDIVRLAEAEGLTAHANSIKVRF